MRHDGNVAGIRLCRSVAEEEKDNLFFFVIEGNVFEMNWLKARIMWYNFIDDPANSEDIDKIDFDSEGFKQKYQSLEKVNKLSELIKNNIQSCADVFGYMRFEKPFKVEYECDDWYSIRLADGNGARLFKNTGKLYEPSDIMNFWNRAVESNDVRGNYVKVESELQRKTFEDLDMLLSLVKFPDLTANEIYSLVEGLKECKSTANKMNSFT